MAKIYATKDGVTADLATKVSYDPDTGAVTSKIILSADQINLDGAVTYSMLAPTFKTDYDGKATTKALDNAVTTLNQTISTLQTEVDKKASTESLDTKVTELNTALGKKADSSKLGSLAYIDDVANAALSGSTLIVNGYLNTDYCKVKTIEATKGTVGGFTIDASTLSVSGVMEGSGLSGYNSYLASLQADGLRVVINEGEKETSFGLTVCTPYDLSFLTPIYINSTSGSKRSDGICCMYANLQNEDYGLFINGGATHILSSELTRIYGLCLKSQAYSGTAGSNMDVIRMTGNLTLMEPAMLSGKIYWIKGNSNYTLTVPRCVDTNNAYTTTPSSITWKDNRTRIFVSDGTVWHEFYATKE